MSIATLDPTEHPTAGRPAIPPRVRRNTLFLAAAHACVGIGNQMTPTLGALTVTHLLGSATFAGAASGIMGAVG